MQGDTDMNTTQFNDFFESTVSNALQSPEEYTPTEQLQIIVTRIIQACGMPAHLRGYRFVRSAIVHTVQEPEMAEAITKLLYPAVAKDCGVSVIGVERAIRHAIEVVWNRGRYQVLNAYFDYPLWCAEIRPTNHEFIATIADRLRIKVHNM